MLRKSDLSPIVYKRVAEADGQEVPWDQIGKGYEVEKGRFILIKNEDLKEVAIEATQTIQIMDFVELQEINPVYFDTPYYLEPQKGGHKAYQLLLQVLMLTGKIGIAKVVIRTKEHLAALKPNGPLLILQLMHFAEDLAPAEPLQLPQSEALDKRELEMAKTLVQSMTDKWDPQKYTDDYSIALMEMIDRKIKQGVSGSKGKTAQKKHTPGVTNLLDILQQSIKSAKPPPRKRKAA